MSTSKGKRTVEPATVTILSDSCSDTGNITASIQVVHTSSEKVGCDGTGLKVTINGVNIPVNDEEHLSSNIEDPAGTFTKIYDINYELGCGEKPKPYTITAKLLFHVLQVSDEDQESGTCAACTESSKTK